MPWKCNRSPKVKGIKLESEWLVITHLSVGEDGVVRVSRFPCHILPPLVRLCPFASWLLPFIVLLPSSLRLIKRIRNPGLIFQLCQNLTFLFIFWYLCFVGGSLDLNESYYMSVFWIWPEWPWIAFFAGDFQQLRLIRHWRISEHVSCIMLSDMTYDVIKLKGFYIHWK